MAAKKYHVNKKGEAGECSAQEACPFGDLTQDHYPTPEEARAAYERKHSALPQAASSAKRMSREERRERSRKQRLEQLREESGQVALPAGMKLPPAKPFYGYLTKRPGASYELSGATVAEALEQMKGEGTVYREQVKWREVQGLASEFAEKHAGGPLREVDFTVEEEEDGRLFYRLRRWPTDTPRPREEDEAFHPLKGLPKPELVENPSYDADEISPAAAEAWQVDEDFYGEGFEAESPYLYRYPVPQEEAAALDRLQRQQGMEKSLKLLEDKRLPQWAALAPREEELPSPLALTQSRRALLEAERHLASLQEDARLWPKYQAKQDLAASAVESVRVEQETLRASLKSLDAKSPEARQANRRIQELQKEFKVKRKALEAARWQPENLARNHGNLASLKKRLQALEATKAEAESVLKEREREVTVVALAARHPAATPQARREAAEAWLREVPEAQEALSSLTSWRAV